VRVLVGFGEDFRINNKNQPSHDLASAHPRLIILRKKIRETKLPSNVGLRNRSLKSISTRI
jgi:hypothetical protein